MLRAVVFTVRAVTVILCVFVLYVFVLLISKFAGWRCAYCVLNVRFCGWVRNVKCVASVLCSSCCGLCTAFHVLCCGLCVL